MKKEYCMCIAFAGVVMYASGFAGQDSTDLRQQILLRSIVSTGDHGRLENVFAKAARKEPVVIGFIGGSITEGAAAGALENRYSNLVTDWFKSTFPDTMVRCMNAGLSASSSNMGAHRVKENLLQYKPDLVVCEYAVNDNGNDLVSETMEGLVRQALTSNNKPAVILLFMCDQNGKNCQDEHIPVGRYYHLPMVSFRDAIYPEVAAGRIKWEDIEADTVHPNVGGHRWIADILISLLESVRGYMPENASTEQFSKLPAPMTANRFEHTAMLCAENYVPTVNYGWSSDDVAGPYRQCLGNGWLSEKPGSILEFDVTGTFISIVYHLDRQTDFGMFEVRVDDLLPVTFNAYAGWIWPGGMCAWKAVASGLAGGLHKVRITLLDEKDADSSGKKVRIMAVMAAGQKES